tara:strand:- start:964 stop:1275 length:312 start_codon:yes stop_codon:yes gene_type:complete
MPGVPDVLICDDRGDFHFVELKVTTGKVVDLSPHQVSWLTKHRGSSCWVITLKKRAKTRPQTIYLHHGRDAMDLKLSGLRTPPIYAGEGELDWETILNLISPI